MRSDLRLGVSCNINTSNVYLSMTARPAAAAAAMLRARRIADYITAQKTACAAGVRGRRREWGGRRLALRPWPWSRRGQGELSVIPQLYMRPPVYRHTLIIIMLRDRAVIANNIHDETCL